MSRWKTVEWEHLYGEQWGPDCTPEAIAHPGKYSRALIRKIYEELLERGWLKPGDVVLDPFGGVGLGGLDALAAGLHWRGIELEPEFVKLAQSNIDLWNKRYAPWMPHWGTAQIIQGDSRNLRKLLKQAKKLPRPQTVVSSPPYQDSLIAKSSKGIHLEKQYATYKKSGGGQTFEALEKTQTKHSIEYGQQPGQLARLKAGNVSAVIGSPPYGVDVKHDYTHDQRDARRGKKQGQGTFRGSYGRTEGQLAKMRAGQPTGVVSSPPYNTAFSQSHNGKGGGKRGLKSEDAGAFTRYGDAQGQIEGLAPETFWEASRQIVAETYLSLAEGGYAVWVTKRTVKDKAIVEFSDQWRKLCQAVGFKTVLWARAIIDEHDGVQLGMEINGQTLDRAYKTGHKAMFRTLNERKQPHTVIDWEDVLFVQKPYAKKD